MAKLWTGRFAKETDHSLDVLNASLPFDQRLYRQDITGSMAHAQMLARQGIISAAEKPSSTACRGSWRISRQAGSSWKERRIFIPSWNRS